MHLTEKFFNFSLQPINKFCNIFLWLWLILSYFLEIDRCILHFYSASDWRDLFVLVILTKFTTFFPSVRLTNFAIFLTIGWQISWYFPVTDWQIWWYFPVIDWWISWYFLTTDLQTSFFPLATDRQILWFFATIDWQILYFISRMINKIHNIFFYDHPSIYAFQEFFSCDRNRK